MSQNSLVLPTTGTLSGLTMAQDINGALDSLNTGNSGAAAPSVTTAYMLWNDTTNKIMWQRNAANTAWIGLWSTASGIDVMPGASRDAAVNVTAASTSATFTASTVIVANGAGGLTLALTSFSQAVNLATTGAGGMDTGSAPVSGFVAIYAIYNIASATTSILACNVTTSSGPTYSGANAPTGYTMSALIGIWPTNASKQFPIGYQLDRKVGFAGINALSTATQQASLTSLSLTSVPAAAKSVLGNFSILSSITSGINVTTGFANSAANANPQVFTYSNLAFANFACDMTTAQTIFYLANVASGTMTFNINVTGYTF